MPTPTEPHQATSEEHGDHAPDAGYAHLAFVFHGAVLNAEPRTARDHYARQPEMTAGEASGRGDAHDVGGEQTEEMDANWPIDTPDLRESLLEAEADRVAGRTLSAEEVRARYGLPPSGTR